MTSPHREILWADSAATQLDHNRDLQDYTDSATAAMSADQEELDEREYVEEAIFQHGTRDEQSPLLNKQHDSNDNLPWTRRPTLFWLLPPFFFTAIMTGASITPRLSLISSVLCRSYYTSTEFPGLSIFELTPGVNCNTAAISGQIARMSTALNTVTGLLAALTAARYGVWSDRHGRRYPLMITMVGSLVNDLCYILVAKYYEKLTIYFLIIGAICDGATGSFMSSMAATYAYATDIVPPQRRAVAFGYFQCCFYGGLAIGPTLGGYLVKQTGNVLLIFYLAMTIHFIFALYTIFLLPESLSKTRMELARIKYETEQGAHAGREADSTPASIISRVLGILNVFKALAVFFPKDAHPTIKRNLRLLMAIDVCLLLNMGIFTVVILYGKFVFNWNDLAQGYLLSIIGGTRVFVLLAVLPVIVRFVRGKIVISRSQSGPGEHSPEGADPLDLGLIRVSMVLEVLGFVLMSTASSSAAFYTAGAMSALAGIGMPTLASVLTKHVPSTNTGQLLGAVALMQSLNRVVAPLAFGLLYSATVASHPATCFIVLATLMALGFLLSLGLRPSTAEHLDTDLSEG